MPGLLYQGLRVRLSQDTPNSLFGRDDLDEEPMLDVLVRLSGPLWREIERERLTQHRWTRRAVAERSKTGWGANKP
mgnify:CR=1 FL=1